MKLTVLFLTVGFLNVSATGVSQNISFSGRNVPLETVFSVVEKQSKYLFLYSNAILQLSKPVSITARDLPVEKFLKEVFRSQPQLQYSIEEKNIFISRKSVSFQLPEETPDILKVDPIDVQGRVVDSAGNPVAGATVIVKGTNRGTKTDENGNFTLKNVNEHDVLLISSVGYSLRSVKATHYVLTTARTSIVILKPAATDLENVNITVSTGYQLTSKERFVGAVAVFDSASYHRRAGMNIVDRLDGTVAGLVFNKKSGTGSPLQNIQIRGVSTLGGPNSPGNVPLVIVDKFPFTQDLSAINPNDIESITILKDAAAASIWGAKAGNGVIVITTKKGNYNRPLSVRGSSNVTVQNKPDLYYFPQMSIADYVDAEIFFFNKGAYDADLINTTQWPIISPVVELLAKRRAGKISAADSASAINGYKNLDLRSQLDRYAYRHAISQQHHVSVSGGSEVFNYSFSAGYNRALNNTRNSKPDDQFTISSTTALRASKKWEINTGINYSYGTVQSTQFRLPSKITPYAQLADAEGNALAIADDLRLGFIDTAGGGKLLDWRNRPLDEPGLADKKYITQFLQLNLGMTYKFTSWLNVSVNYQYGRQSSDNNEYQSLQTWYTRNLINRYTNLSQTLPHLRNPVPVGGILNRSYSVEASQNARAQLNFNKNFRNRHAVIAMVAGEISASNSTGGRSTFYGYDIETDVYQSSVDYINNYPIYGGLNSAQPVPNGHAVVPSGSRRFVSFVGNVSYTFDNRYSVYASARKDGSNVFGVNTNKKWTPLWSSGISWDIAKESFYHIGWMSSLRLRLSYGYTGNPGSGSGYATIRYSSAPALYTNLPTVGIGDAPNPDLRWERVGITNLALDFSLFRNRLSGSVDVFHKNATDLIGTTGLAPSTGVTTYVINTANLKGNGFEINLNSKNLTGAFQWQTRFGLAYAKMVVTKLYNNLYLARQFITYSMHAAEGKVAYGLASYKWGGLDPATGDPRGYLNKQVSANYTDILRDSVDNQVFHGSAIPLYSGFIGNTFSWKHFSLSANISYRFNFYFRKPSISYDNLLRAWVGHADFGARWQKPGDEQVTNVPSFNYPLNIDRESFYQQSEVNVLRGDNIRLQDVRLDYTWNDSRKGRRLPFTSVQAFLYANNLNLILWRKNTSNLDPDFVGGPAFLAPVPITWTGGVSLGF